MARKAVAGAVAAVRSKPTNNPGQNFQANLGKQLSSRVSSGAISQQKAEKTASQRALLKKAYGSDWRTKVYGDKGYVKRARKAAASGDESGQALYKQLLRQRKGALKRARAKV